MFYWCSIEEEESLFSPFLFVCLFAIALHVCASIVSAFGVWIQWYFFAAIAIDRNGSNNMTKQQQKTPKQPANVNP